MLYTAILSNPHFFSFIKFPFLFSSTMGNSVTVCRHHNFFCFGALATGKNRNVVQLVKSDGKIREFSTPILVKDVLLNFSGFGIALATNNPLHLPSSFRLKLGSTYYLIPSVGSLETAEESQKIEKEEASSVKRIKVVITRQQLHDLLSRQVLPVDILSGLKSTSSSDNDENSVSNWKPGLESIPEENELSSFLAY